MTAVACPGCGATFDCNPGPDCWCAKIPFQPMPDAAEACFCPACFKARSGSSTTANQAVMARKCGPPG